MIPKDKALIPKAKDKDFLLKDQGQGLTSLASVSQSFSLFDRRITEKLLNRFHKLR